MKKTIATMILVGLIFMSLKSHAQNEAAKPAAADNAAGTAASAAKPADLDSGKKEADEVIQFGEDVPLAKVIKTLAGLANTNIQFDPRILATLPSNTIPAIKFENVSPISALKAVLANNELMILGDADTGIGRVTKKPTAEPLITRVLQLKYSNPSNMVDVIKQSFKANQASAFPDPRTSQLIVAATAREMEEITNLVAQIDLPTKQILIEAKIMETAKNPSSVKGIDWSGTLAGQNVAFGNGYMKADTTMTTPGSSSTANQTLPSGRTLSSTTTSGADSKSVFSGAFDGLNNLPGLSLNTAQGFSPSTAFLTADGLKAVLSFLNQDADTEVVATPRAVTLDNEPAILSVTRAYPVFKITPGTAQTPAGSEVTWTNLGTILNVTPRIAGNDQVSMKVTPEVSSIDSKDRQTINGNVNEANVYAIRKIDTKVMIPSGHTLVMGGLISDSTTKQYTKVPLLGDIPGLGYAFRRDSKTRNKQNLLIFITPTIVKDSDFQKYDSTFLQQKMIEKPEPKETLWDTGKPKLGKKAKNSD